MRFFYKLKCANAVTGNNHSFTESFIRNPQIRCVDKLIVFILNQMVYFQTLECRKTLRWHFHCGILCIRI